MRLCSVLLMSAMIAIAAFPSTSAAQNFPPDRFGLERGQGGWMELLPETYGYFGPDFVLAHRDSLGLGPSQQRAIEELYDRMRTSVLEKGKLILAAEEDLEDMFVTGKATEEVVSKQSILIGKMRGELRSLYLGAAIAMHPILNDRQRAILTRLLRSSAPVPPETR